MNERNAFIGGLLCGALLMFIMDPVAGGARRGKASQKTLRSVKRAGQGLAGTAKHVKNRAQGLVHEAKSRIMPAKEEPVAAGAAQ